MATPTHELRRVLREQEQLYDAMVRSIWGDRVTLALTTATVAGMGMGLLMSRKLRSRLTGSLLYATAAGFQLYVAMKPKSHRAGHGMMAGTEGEATRVTTYEATSTETAPVSESHAA